MLKIWILGLLLSITPLAFGMSSLPGGNASGKLVGNPAPGFTLDTAYNGTKSLDQARQGKKAVIFFWATWCPHCHDELMVVRDHLNQIKAKGLQVILVDVGETQPEVQKYLQYNKIDLDSFIDSENSLQDTYQLIGVPTMFWLDEKGIIRKTSYTFDLNYS